MSLPCVPGVAGAAPSEGSKPHSCRFEVREAGRSRALQRPEPPGPEPALWQSEQVHVRLEPRFWEELLVLRPQTSTQRLVRV